LRGIPGGWLGGCGVDNRRRLHSYTQGYPRGYRGSGSEELSSYLKVRDLTGYDS